MINKTCRTCNQEKDISNFSLMNKRKKDNHNPDCKICRSTKRRELARSLKAEAIAYKGGKCNDCLQIVHQAAFEFHHLDALTKADKEPAHFLQDSKSLNNKAKQELDKCVLLCANCHRVRHFSDLF